MYNKNTRIVSAVSKVGVVLFCLSAILSKSVFAAVDCYEEVDPYYKVFDVRSMIHIHDENDAKAVRSKIVNFFWRESGWPGDKMPSGSDFNTPNQIPGLCLWLDASDTKSICLGPHNGIVRWQDKSGHNSHAVLNGLNRSPLYKLNSINGRPSVIFEGNDILEINQKPNLQISKLTVFAVINIPNPNSLKFPAQVIQGSTCGFILDANKNPVFKLNSRAYCVNNSILVNNSPAIWTGIYDGNNLKFNYDGVQVAKIGAPGLNIKNSDSFRIGDANGFRGAVAEILIYDSPLTDRQVQNVQNYLTNKYNIFMPPQIAPAWVSEIGSTSLIGVQKLDIEMDYGIHSYSYLLMPKNSTNRLLIFHMGHDSNLLVCGGKETIKFFLDHGFAILTFWMPTLGENSIKAYNVPGHGEVSLTNHNQMPTFLENGRGSFMRFFVEPVIVATNYAESRYNFNGIYMTGVSGGGWTTHMCAAIDPRITKSFPTAGSLPTYLRYGPCGRLDEWRNSQGDAEQEWGPFYQNIANDLDIYILGGYGTGRQQIHILNKYDAGCFFGVGYKTYEPYLIDAVNKLGSGSYKVYLDSSHREHRISDLAIKNVIYPAIEAANQ